MRLHRFPHSEVLGLLKRQAAPGHCLPIFAKHCHKHWWATTAFLAQFSYPVAGWERHPEANPKPVVKLSSGCLADAEGTGASSSPAQTCTHRPMGTWRQQFVLHSSKPCSWHCQPLDTPKAAPRIHQLWQRWSTGWEMPATPRCCEVTGSEVK